MHTTLAGKTILNLNFCAIPFSTIRLNVPNVLEQSLPECIGDFQN